MLFMGIDVGSSGCKVSVVDEKGAVIHFAQRRYSFQYTDGLSELNPNLVFEKVLEAIKDITNRCSINELATLSVTSFGEMFVLLDENRNVLCNSISYDDRRGKAEAEDLLRDLGDDEVYKITGATISAMYSLPKLLWVKHNRPEIYKKAKKLCLFADYILIKLGAEYHIDYSLAARTLMFDVREKCWSKKILEYAGIEYELLSDPVPTGTVVGKIDSALAEELALPSNVLLLAGGHDQSCAALGAGIVQEGMALDGMGSNECIVPAFAQAMINRKMQNTNLACVPYSIPDMYITYAFNRTSGTVLDWYRKILGNPSYDEMFADIGGRPSGILFLPHFAGAATPYMDDDALGAVVGLNLSTTKSELTRSVIEGLNYEVMVNLQCLNNAGFHVRELFVSGGMSQNDKVLQIKADMLGLPIHRLKNAQTGTMAMAVFGSVAMGHFKDSRSAAAQMIRRGRVFLPNESLHDAYSEWFEKYKKMYSAVKMIRGDMV